MAVAPVEDRPIRLVVRDELRRSRLTVLFRLLLAIPLVVWLTLWGIATFVVAFVMWLAVLINGRAPETIHDFVAGYVRYATQVSAYLFLAADPYPWFRGSTGYPVDVEIAPPAEQSRWTALVRLILAIPAFVLAAALGGGLFFGSSGGSWGTAGGDGGGEAAGAAISFTGTAAAAAFLAWFAILAKGRSPRGLRDLVAYALGYSAQAAGYLFLLTGRYPTSDPALAEEFSELPEHPVQIAVTDDLGRPRLTVLFRVLLAIPHFVWLALWTVAAFLAAIVAWFAALVTGRVPTALHRFLAAYVRYTTHVLSYVYVIARRFPGFTGRAGSYGVDVEIAAPERQNRWKTLFRIFLALPALLLESALGGVALIVGIFGWWYALVTGRMPEGLRNLGAACLRYGAQTSSYVLLLTDRYPYSAPVLEAGRPPQPESVTRSFYQPLPPPPPPAQDAL